MRLNISLVMLAAALLMSCGHEKYEKSDIKETIVLNIDKCDDVNINDIGSSQYEIVPLENNPQFMVSNVDKMIVTERGIYILDTRHIPTLYLFGHDGKAIRKIGKQGHSKSEYVRIDNFTANERGDTVALLDEFGKMVKLYSDKDEFLGSHTFDESCGWDDCMMLDNKIYMSSYHHANNCLIAKYSMDLSAKESVVCTGDELIPGPGCFFTYTQHSSKYICFLDYYKSSFYLIDRTDETSIIKFELQSDNILSPEKKDYVQAPYDAILEYVLTDNYIFMEVTCKEHLKSYMIDIEKRELKQVTFNVFKPSTLDCYKGTCYGFLMPQSIKDISFYCSANKELMRVIAPHKGSVSDSNNLYILKTRLLK